MSLRRVATTLGLLWLLGNGLRLTILAVPPVIPMLRSELGLSGTEIGILTGLPIILFAGAALPGALLIARLGAITTIITGLLLAAFAAGLRGAATNVVTLDAATVLMGAGIAITQPAMPALVRRWLPNRIGLATAVYTNGLLVGEILPVALFPAIFPLVGESWRGSFVFWALPLVAIAAVVPILAPRQPAGAVPAARPRWWPDWRDREIWRLGFIFGSANTMYFASNAFLPGYLTEAGRADLISASLTALNLGQLPASLLLLGFAGRLERKRWPFVAAGLVGLASIVGIVIGAGMVTVACAGILGFAAGGAFALGLTLPPLLSAPGDVARMSAAMFTVSYTGAVVISVLAGATWDFGGMARFAFLPIGLSALPMILLAPTLVFIRRPAP
jgi:CP family cyanate transporter-like MFS transporter